MKFIHLSDLHIGKRVNEFSMLEDQEYILFKIINIIDDEKVDSVLIAGDIYDKSVPSAEAVQLFDDFLTKLADRNLSVFIISGNHDSPERIAFGGRLMSSRRVFMSPVYEGEIVPVMLSDGYGEICVYMLPFIKPAHVKRIYPETEIETYNEAVKTVIGSINIDSDKRNILVAHQFVTGAERCESEDVSIGGLDNVDATVFEVFDYAALGHIHGLQSMQSETVRYSGTPLKYSFSEVSHKKSATIIEFGEKGSIAIRTVPLIPKRDMREIKGTYSAVTALDNYRDTNTDDYMHITLTDEEDIPDAVGKLRSIYPNIMKLDYDNNRTRSNQTISGAENAEQKTPLKLFEEFYLLQNNKAMSEEQREFALGMIEKIWNAKE
ncbi:MAG: exonuclease SbcCD subunit D [Eubacteriales bacterium]